MKDEPKRNQETFRLLPGGQHQEVRLNSVRIVAATEHHPPFAVDAMAAEEDTCLVLSADVEVREPEHPIRVMKAVLEAAPETPGTVIVKPGRPLQLLAVVHDFNEDPSWREVWVASALDEIFQEADRRQLRSLGLPMLATLHGTLEPERFLVLLRGALERADLSTLRRLWLILQPGSNVDLLDELTIPENRSEAPAAPESAG